MIDPIELRIYNILQYKGAICHVLTISKTSIRCSIENDLDEDMFNIEDLSGLELTEEWLVKLGFEYNHEPIAYTDVETGEDVLNDNDMVNRWHKQWPNSKKIFIIYVIGNGEYNYMGTNFKYVHQLQNLYFALTGEELEIKPPL